jgi:hypothetical protein
MPRTDPREDHAERNRDPRTQLRHDRSHGRNRLRLDFEEVRTVVLIGEHHAVESTLLKRSQISRRALTDVAHPTGLVE